MKIGQIKRTYSSPAAGASPMAGAPPGSTPPTVTEDLDIPLRNILTFLFSAAGISAVTALVSVFVVQGPQTRAAVAKTHAQIQKERVEFQRDVVYSALALEQPRERKVAMELFIHAGLLDASLRAALPDTLPHMPTKPKTPIPANPQIAQAAN